MTQDIIAIAREAGIKSGDIYKRTVGHMSIETLERFEALVRADERKWVLDYMHIHGISNESLNKAIRARGQAS